MSWYTSLLREDVTFWLPPVRDGEGGYTWSPPTQLKGRWEDAESLIYAQDGSYTVSSATVWVGTSIAEGSYLYRGIYNETQPPDEAKQVMTVDVMNSLPLGDVGYYKVYLR